MPRGRIILHLPPVCEFFWDILILTELSLQLDMIAQNAILNSPPVWLLGNVVLFLDLKIKIYGKVQMHKNDRNNDVNQDEKNQQLTSLLEPRKTELSLGSTQWVETKFTWNRYRLHFFIIA